VQQPVGLLRWAWRDAGGRIDGDRTGTRDKRKRCDTHAHKHR
jgi:hypothetical protein